jgi:hypothetical protein
MGLLRILCSSAFACALVLLLVGCGANPTTSTTTSNSSTAGLTAGPQTNGAGTSPQTNGAATSPQTEGAGTNPQTEGNGPESPQSAGNGGVSVPLAGLPIGDGSQAGDNQGNNECVRVAWLGQITHAGVVLTVTGVGVTGQPPAQFTTVDTAAAGCPQDNPPCVGSKFTMANNNGGLECYAGVQYTGPPLPDTSTSADGTLQLNGSLSCQNVDSATCEKYVQPTGGGTTSVSISFFATSTSDGGSAPSDTSSL